MLANINHKKSGKYKYYLTGTGTGGTRVEVALLVLCLPCSCWVAGGCPSSTRVPDVSIILYLTRKESQHVHFYFISLIFWSKNVFGVWLGMMYDIQRNHKNLFPFPVNWRYGLQYDGINWSYCNKNPPQK